MTGIVNSTGARSGIIGTTVGSPSPTNAADIGSGVLPVGVTGGSGLTLLKSARNEGLIVKYVSATTVDIDADYLTVFDSSNVGSVLSSINLTADITASGVNGLDTGSEATSTWYHIWVIYNGTTTASLLSVSATSPTMPSGYTYKKYVGAVYNKADGNFSDFEQHNYLVTVPTLVDQSLAGSSSGTLSLAGLVPTTAIAMFGEAKVKSSGSQKGWLTLSAKSGWGACNILTDAAVSNSYVHSYYRLPLLLNSFYWTATSNDAHILRINGWEYGGIE